MKTAYIFLGADGKKYSYVSYLEIPDYAAMQQASKKMGVELVEIVSKKSIP
jgi:hypothetical protein